ncbi:patatin-like phospholipase family protein [Aestuariivirga sp. YIM B02566]|uniref:Patatin-like phospholipase family protein n=1 Tax=Taklimakanibacter albus TaxID=2800327 RepID=A0ACC5QZW0_9HYPH|nr:patatin-like phospholipase family protein [Aestuariivirga sp. YIM B02566]MBK1865939.1 patatin-like phospholipase family protein [Aestuariivirga sp. YIM B02566]
MATTNSSILEPKKAGQRRLLALDGGGIRGLITLGILEKMEADLRRILKKDASFRLADYFDFIGGTSTGAILAVGLSIGLSASELTKFYLEAGPLMFKKEELLERLWNKFKSDPLEMKLKEILGKTTELGSPKLKTLLLLVMRNVSTDSPWPVTNNPNAHYNARDRDDCNLKLPLWQLVRASTAAPTYFPPEVVKLKEGRQFVFVDGGVTPYNIPAFLMFRKATAEPYRLLWERGEDKMLIVSAGTGSAPRLGPQAGDPNRSLLEVAMSIAGEMMNGMAYDQDINCRTVGRCVFGPEIDREVKDMVPAQPLSENLGRSFLYARYDPDLTREGLDALGLKKLSPEAVGKMDSVKAIDDLMAVGKAYAKKALDIGAQWGPFGTAAAA